MADELDEPGREPLALRTPEPPPGPRTSGWVLLGVVAVAAAVLITVLAVVDLGAVEDDSWRTAGLWTAGVALALLGVALAAVAWRLAPSERGWGWVRIVVVLAVVGVVAGGVVVGLAREQGGAATEPVAADPVGAEAADPAGEGTAPLPDESVGLDDALDIEGIVGSSLPVDVRTSVALDLTRQGRELAAEAGGCAPRDYRGAVLGVAIGGSWAQPLVLLGPPLDADGDPIQRCRNAILRLPLEAGLALPS